METTRYKCIKEVEAKPMGRKTAEQLGLVRDKTGTNEKGYHVIYSHDYESWSPAKSFEEGYKVLGEKTEEDRCTKCESEVCMCEEE